MTAGFRRNRAFYTNRVLPKSKSVGDGPDRQVGPKKFAGHVDFPHVARRKVERDTLRPLEEKTYEVYVADLPRRTELGRGY